MYLLIFSLSILLFPLGFSRAKRFMILVEYLVHLVSKVTQIFQDHDRLSGTTDLYSDDVLRGPITLRSSPLSIFALGVSLGYFLSDLGMIIWFYPSLGGMEYVLHHLLSIVGVTYAMLTGEAQVYTFYVLLSEATTPSINLRWYLDAAGMKRSRMYIINGVIIFLAWLVARILLFIYLLYHAYLHYDQVKQMHTFGVSLVHVVPPVLSVMNLIWFWKIFKGMQKTLAKRQ